MKMKFKPIYLALSLAIAQPTVAYAGGVPTIDVASITQLINAVEVLRTQLRQLEQTRDSLTGARDRVTGLFPNFDDRSIDGTLQAIRLGLTSLNTEMTLRMGDLNQTYKTMDGTELFAGDNAGRVRGLLHNEMSNSVIGELAFSEDMFSKSVEAMNRYDTFSQTLGGTVDLKESTDLNTRVSIENGVLLTQLLQIMAVRSQTEAIQGNADLRYVEEAARLNRPQ